MPLILLVVIKIIFSNIYIISSIITITRRTNILVSILSLKNRFMKN